MTHYQNISIKSSKTYPCLTFKVLNLKTKKQNNNNNNKNVFGRFLGLLEIAWLEGYFCFLEVFSREQLHWGSREKRGQLFMAQKPLIVTQDYKDQPRCYSKQISSACIQCWYLNREATPNLSALMNKSHVL